MRIKLNGWQRIGIVVSVIWIVGLPSYLFFQREHDAMQSWVMRDAWCIERFNGDDRKKWDEYKACMDESKNSYWLSARAFGNEMPLIFAIDFGIVILGWLIVWFGIVVTRWIRRGFA